MSQTLDEINGQLIHARDWNGPNDPGNPRNFTLVRRISSTFAVTFLAFVSTFAGSVYSPGIHAVAREFDVSEEIAILPLSLYTIGLALGPLLGGPLCETLGRKIVYLVTSPLFALFTLGAGFSHTITALVVCRFFAGLFAAPAVGNASATIIDYTAGRYRTVIMSFYFAIPIVGANCGPLVGGLVAQARGWRWTQWTVIFLLILVYIPIVFTKESYKKIILQKRAKALGVEGPREDELTPVQFAQRFVKTQLVRPIHMLFTEPIVTLVCSCNGLLFGLIYLFVVASPWIYQEYYSFNLTGQSLSFLGLTVGAILAPLPIMVLDHIIYQPRLKRFQQQNTQNAQFPAENRLVGALVCSFIQPAALFGFAWTSRPGVRWIVPMLFQSLSMMTSIVIYVSVQLFMMDTYGPLYGASAAGAAMFSRYGLSAAFPLFALQMYRSLGVGWATSILAFCTLAMAPIPWLFWRCADRLRDRTKYETSA